jgi:hypothetical protein
VTRAELTRRKEKTLVVVVWADCAGYINIHATTVHQSSSQKRGHPFAASTDFSTVGSTVSVILPHLNRSCLEFVIDWVWWSSVVVTAVQLVVSTLPSAYRNWWVLVVTASGIVLAALQALFLH